MRWFAWSPTPRRQFLVFTALGAAGLLTGADRRKAPPVLGPQEALTEAERAVLEAATGRLLPSEDGPGAREANVTGFIVQQLATPALAPLGPVFKGIVQLLDQAAIKEIGVPFAAAAPQRQDAILLAFSKGTLTTRFPQREAFQLLHTFTLEGFLSDPIHGGNANRAGWKAIGFRGPEHSH